MTGKMRFGLVGTGRIGRVHAANIAAHPEAELAWIADPFLEGAERLSSSYGGKITRDPEVLLTSGEIDAAIIASPTPTHVPMIQRCAELGIPVLCEKPIDLDLERVDRLAADLASHQVPISIGFNRRFDPAFSYAREQVKAGAIGNLEQLIIISRDPSAPPAEYISVSGGIFRDMTIHDFDMARFFLEGITEVTAVGTNVFDEGARAHHDFDGAITTLKSSSGASVTIINSRHSSTGYDQRLEIFGSEGVLHVANESTNLVSISNSSLVESKQPYESVMFERYKVAYLNELNEFIALLTEGSSTSPSFHDGRAALILAEAAQRSAETGKTVRVDLDASE